ncbi:NAD(P)/FAD-dependent oxidoreductase [Dactylosporangium darangshiense]|uniref:hypothetical protein n=1 Tax=Dactylosporangium darangshiense TaxID=579108 RepID=UPI00363E945D
MPSQVYSFSFALKPDWTSTYSRQGEIWQYLRECAQRFGVRDKIRFGADVRRAEWDANAGRWRIATSVGEWTADVLIAAAGPLNEPAMPKLPGMETFQGRRSTPRGGTTMSSWRASASPSSGRGPPRCRSCRPSSPLSKGSRCSSGRPRG